jgi:hypothetical protein
MLVLQPVVSLDNWNGSRKVGLTKRERGIPLPLLRSMLTDEALAVEYESPCDFPSLDDCPRLRLCLERKLRSRVV